MALNFKKLTAAIHYICEKADKDKLPVDGIKLNKVLWYSDAHAYLARKGASITGETYIRKQHGPVAKHNTVAIKALRSEGKVLPGKKHVDGKWVKCLDSVGAADKSLFQGEELQIIDTVIKKVCDQETYAMSEKTHGEIWKIAKNGEEIPLRTIFVENLGEISPEHIKIALAGEW